MNMPVFVTGAFRVLKGISMLRMAWLRADGYLKKDWKQPLVC